MKTREQIVFFVVILKTNVLSDFLKKELEVSIVKARNVTNYIKFTQKSFSDIFVI